MSTISTHQPSQPQAQSRTERKNAKKNTKFQKKPTGKAASKPTQSAGNPNPPRTRPTHFLALPLHNHPSLRNQISAFQNALFSPPPAQPQTPMPVFDTRPREAEPNPAKTEVQTSKHADNTKGKARKKSTLSPTVQGLDTSIIIDPRRMHMTLGVMALELDSPSESEIAVSRSLDSQATTLSTPLTEPPSSAPAATIPKKTIATALSLLTSLKPRISEILDGSKGVSVPLETMHVLKTSRIKSDAVRTEDGARSTTDTRTTEPGVDVGERGSGEVEGSVLERAGDDAHHDTPVTSAENLNDEKRKTDASPSGGVPDTKRPDKVGAGVLYIAPRTRSPAEDDDRGGGSDVNVEYRKLMQVCDLVHQTFKAEGYITDTRPLTLHCTILNASHRKPPRRIPFSYTDILESDAMKLLKPTDTLEGLPASTDNDNDIKVESGPSETTEGEGNANAPETLAQDVGDLNLTLAQALPESLSLDPSLPPPPPKPKPKFRPPITVPPPVSIDLGEAVRVHEIQLWEMGSHGPNNEYVNCGGIVLE